MTVRECLDEWTTMSDEVKMKCGSALFDMLTPLSLGELQSFQQDWHTTLLLKEAEGLKSDSDDEEFMLFKEAQKQVLEKCLSMEMHKLGTMVRQKLGLSPTELKWDTQIPEDVEVEMVDGKTQG